ncbi:MAG TPA: M20 family metallopeptidase [Tissierellaceae bacterium]|nr:M20 family metallopeptidase [Tissierellaceae bacterium]
MKNDNFVLEQYLDELEELVNIDSGSTYVEGVNKIADIFKEKYENLGFLVKEHNFSKDAGSCLEIRNKDGKDIDILIIGHMDTVFKKGTAAERPFTIKGDRAYGPGVADMKSGLLSTYYSMKLLNKEVLDKLNICIFHNSDEEISSIYSQEKIKELARKSRYAFVMEPGRSDGSMVTERKGLAKYFIDFHGVAAHAGVEPEKGKSAIHELGNWIVNLVKLNDYESGTSVNIGVVEGGTVPNVVADKAHGQIDIRFKSDNVIDDIEKAMQELKENPLVEGIDIKVERKGYRPPMNPNEDVYKLCRQIEKIGEELGIEIKWTATGGGSDANFTSAEGVPSIDSMGPIGGGAHGVDEYIEIDSIEPRIKLFTRLLENLAD